MGPGGSLNSQDFYMCTLNFLMFDYKELTNRQYVYISRPSDLINYRQSGGTL